ncbi:MAG: FHA domain-containing protein [Myxococcales bacterium]
MKLIIEDDEGQTRVVPVVGDEVTIGREDGNTVRLPERNVSRRHARLVRNDGYFVIEDLGSYNGVRINGARIDTPRRVQEGDRIQIGDYDLGIEGKPEPAAAHPPLQTPASPARAAHQSPANGAGGATAIIRVSDLMKAPPRAPRSELLKSERPRLVGLSQTVHGQEFPLERADVRIGRARENDIVIEHPSLSRQHARLLLGDDEWKIVDYGSANGIRVNGDPYAMSALHPGDVIELGHVKLRFCGPGEKFMLPREADEHPRRRRSSTTILVGALLAIGVAGAAAAVYFLKIARPAPEDGEMSAEAALKAGDLLFREKEFLRAVELYEQASAKGENAPNLSKAVGEARAQRIDQDLDRAIAASDFDKARGLVEKCADTLAWYCEKARDKADRVREGYARQHLDKARAAKGTKPEACQGEVRLVLAFDPANTEAQQLLGQCAPAPAPPPKELHKPAVESQASRDDKARALLNAGNALTETKDPKKMPAAMAKYQAALDLKPSGSLRGFAYRGLGTASVYLGDAKAAAGWLKRYLPYVDDPATREQVETLIRRYGVE